LAKPVCTAISAIDRRKANISKLIATLNEDDDIEEQQQAVAAIRSSNGFC
jgi:hypothetical protein